MNELKTFPLDKLSASIMEELIDQDPQVAAFLEKEAFRQSSTIELIASENHVSPAVMHTVGTWLTNKYAEGYPGKRYYGGCVHHDSIEQLAIDRAKLLFNCKFANVQPHSGANANIAAFMALLGPGDHVLSLPIRDGGHLSHGLKPNFSGTFYKIFDYALDTNTEELDYEKIAEQARICKPKLIICGYSAYSRIIDFKKFSEIANEVGAYLMADIAHIAGLVAGGAHPSPFPYADIVTTTTHKTLRGPRGGLILTNNEEIAKKVDRKVFPGSQGGPLMHVIAGKAVAFGEALEPSFKKYVNSVVENAKTLANSLSDSGYRLCTGGTENHLMLVDLRTKNEELTGSDAETWLEKSGIIVNKNGIPGDPRPPMVTSGLRLGTPAVTTRGFLSNEMVLVAEMIDEVLDSRGDSVVIDRVKQRVIDLTNKFKLPH